jgi:hypothetical protein
MGNGTIKPFAVFYEDADTPAHMVSLHMTMEEAEGTIPDREKKVKEWGLKPCRYFAGPNPEFKE